MSSLSVRPYSRRGRAPRTGRGTHALSRSPFAVPGLILLAAFSLYPILVLVQMSVSEVTSGTLNSSWPFVGLSNFQSVWQGPDLRPALVRTAVFVAIVAVLGIVGGLGVAVALRGGRRGSALLLAMMVFTWALPPVVNGSVWKFLLADDGLLNTLLREAHLSAGLPFLYDQRYALISVALVNSWAVIPFNALVFRAALMSIDPSILEAAALDGVSKWQEIRFVLVPSVRPTALILAILTVVYAFRSFDFVYVMTTGGPGNATTTLPYLSYSQAFVDRDFGTGSATGALSLVIVAVLAVVYVRVSRQDAR